MPLIHLHCPRDTFGQQSKNAMVDQLTTIALKIEGLPDTAFVRSTAWTFINEHEPQNIFKGGKTENANGIYVEVNVFKGGLDIEQKGELIAKFTRIIQLYLAKPAPIYVLIRENETEDWGILGNRITLDKLFNPPADALPI